MRLRIKNRRWLWLALLGLTIASTFAPEPARAYDFHVPVSIDPGTNDICPGPGLFRRIMPCIKETIIYAINDFIYPFSEYLWAAVGAACTLAIAAWGYRMASGDYQAPRLGPLLLIKLAAVMTMCAAFGAVFPPFDSYGGLFPIMLDVMEDLLGVVSGYALNSSLLDNPNCIDPFSEDLASLMVWDLVDCSVDMLIGGVFSPFTLMGGIIGFLVACFLSNVAGFFIAMMGFYMIVQFLMAVARALYIFVSAYIGFALMVMISPLFIPLMLFEHTKAYFQQWLKVTGNFLLQPLIIFAYLNLLLAAFDVVVYTGNNSIFRAIAGSDVDQGWFNDPWCSGAGGIGGWMECSGAYGAGSIGGNAVNIDPKQTMKQHEMPDSGDTGLLGVIGKQGGDMQTAFQDDVFEFLGIGTADDLNFFKVDMPTKGVDWEWLAEINGWDETEYIVGVLLSFMMAVITAYIFMTLLDYLPLISGGIAGKPLGMPALGTGKGGGDFMSGLQSKLAAGITRGGA